MQLDHPFLLEPDAVRVCYEGQEPRKNGGEVRCRIDRDRGTCLVEVTADEPLCELSLLWSVGTPADALVLGDAWERSYGELGWAPENPDRMLPWYAFSFREGRTTAFGISVRPNAFGAWYLRPRETELRLDLRNGGLGVRLGGRTLPVCEVLSEVYDGVPPYRAGQDFCRKMAGKPLLPPQPLYGGNNWYYAYGRSSEGEILEDARLQAELAAGLPNRPFMVIDDGWQMHSVTGPWEPNERFPDMARLAADIRAMDVRPGLWVRYLTSEDPLPGLAHLENGALDPSDPKVLDYVRRETKKFVGWGYELIKHDFSTLDLFQSWGKDMSGFPRNPGGHLSDPGRTNAQVIKDFYRTILESAGGRALILGCNAIPHLGVGYMHANRTGDDTSGHHFDLVRKNGFNALAFRLMQNRTFYAADADCAGFVPGRIPWEENRQWVTMLAGSGSPLFISCARTTLTDEQKAYMRKMYRMASEQKEDPMPLDWMETKEPCRYE